MFKRIISILLVIAVFFSFSGFASSKKTQEVDLSTPQAKIEQSVLQYPATNEDFRYDVYTYYIVITECLSTKSNIIIPDTIQDLPVYKIAKNAFANQTAITSVTMTNNIIEIGERAFFNCSNLQNVNLSNGLLTCGTFAFSNCDSLKTITIPASLYTIPGSMFAECDRLAAAIIEEAEVVAPTETNNQNAEEGRKISAAAFGSCSMLKNVWIPKDIITIEATAFSLSMENLTIYGEAQSSAAHYASENLLDFVVLSKNEFKNILSSAMTTEKVSLHDSIESDTWKITFNSAYSLRGKFNYNTNGTNKEKSLSNNNELIVLCFSAKNLAAGEQFFNFLDVNASVNEYSHKISSYGSISYPQFSQHNTPLVGKVKPGEILYGYIAIETTAGWKNTSVQFMNDTALENFSFIIKSDDKNVTYIGSIENPVDTIPENQPSETPNTETTNPSSETTEPNTSETTTVSANSETTTEVATSAPSTAKTE